MAQDKKIKKSNIIVIASQPVAIYDQAILSEGEWSDIIKLHAIDPYMDKVDRIVRWWKNYGLIEKERQPIETINKKNNKKIRATEVVLEKIPAIRG